jgi:MBG domain-containing protein
VTGSPACTTPATASSPNGSYAITCTIGTLSSANYNFLLDPGTLTVGKVQTSLTAQPISLLRSLLSAQATMTATLRSSAAGQPLAGQTVAFTLGGQSCSATTNANGIASCSVGLAVALLNPGGYSAAYAGSANYLPSSATARITLL